MTQTEGLGAFANPWRQLTGSEIIALENDFPCMNAMLQAPYVPGNSGTVNQFFSCHGLSFLRQRTRYAGYENYWYIYNHPAPLRLPTGQLKPTETLAPARSAIPVWGSQASTVQHWGLIGVPMNLNGFGSNLMAQMHRGYRHHRRIGALPDDLTAFDGTISAADFYLANSEWQNAVVAYQAAGATGATTIGPEIDAATGGATQPATQQAWAINGNLASVNNTSSATQSDAISAQGFVRQMQNLYHSALSQAQGGGGGGGGPTQPSQALTGAASTLVSYLQTNGCSQASISQVVAFQTQYNAEGSQQLAVDGKYGPETQGALQRVLTVSGGGTAPQNCFPAGGGGGGGGGGGATPGGGGGGTTATPTQAGVFPWGTAALITSAIVAAGYVAYESKHGKHMMRHAGHHARRLHHGLRHRLLRRRRA